VDDRHRLLHELRAVIDHDTRIYQAIGACLYRWYGVLLVADPAVEVLDVSPEVSA